MLTRNNPAIQNAKLFDWFIYLYEIMEEAIEYSLILAIAELMKTGCTLSTEHRYISPYMAKVYEVDTILYEFPTQ